MLEFFVIIIIFSFCLAICVVAYPYIVKILVQLYLFITKESIETTIDLQNTNRPVFSLYKIEPQSDIIDLENQSDDDTIIII